jgi:hypothetical protein
MNHRTRLHEDVRIVAPPAGLADAGELLDDELEAVVGGLERVWLPNRDASPAAAGGR